MKNKTKTKIALEVIFVILFLNVISSSGVSAPYWNSPPENPLRMYPGEIKTINLNLQNIAGEPEDITMKIEILNGSEITSLEKDEFLVEAGTEEYVPIKIKIPSETPIGTIFPIKILVRTVTSGEQGGVAFGTAEGVNFNVIIGEKIEISPETKTPSFSYLWVLVLVIIIAITIIIVAITKKKHKKK